MKIFRLFAALAAVLFLLTGQVIAVDLPDELIERFGLSELQEQIPDEARSLAEDAGFGDLSLGEILELTPDAMIRLAKSAVRGAVDSYRQVLFSLLGLILLFAAVGQLGGESFPQEIAGCLFSVFVVLTTSSLLLHAIGTAADTIGDASRFLMVFVPIYAAVLTAGGAAATASFYHIAVLGGAQVVGAAANSLLVPCGCIFLNLCIAESFAGELFPRWSLSIKKAVNWLLVLLVTIFTGLLSLQSVLTGAADGASVKTVKFLVGTFVPVIGSAVSDAVQAAQGSLRIIRAAAGSFGIAVTALTFLPALAEVLILRLIIGAASFLAEMLSACALLPTLQGIGHLLSVLTALLLTMALLMIVSTAIVLSAGGAV